MSRTKGRGRQRRRDRAPELSSLSDRSSSSHEEEQEASEAASPPVEDTRAPETAEPEVVSMGTADSAVSPELVVGEVAEHPERPERSNDSTDPEDAGAAPGAGDPSAPRDDDSAQSVETSDPVDGHVAEHEAEADEESDQPAPNWKAPRPLAAQDILNAAMGGDLIEADEVAAAPTHSDPTVNTGLPVQPINIASPNRSPEPKGEPVLSSPIPGPKVGAAFAKIELPGLTKPEDPLALLAQSLANPATLTPVQTPPVVTDAALVETSTARTEPSETTDENEPGAVLVQAPPSTDTDEPFAEFGIVSNRPETTQTWEPSGPVPEELGSGTLTIPPPVASADHDATSEPSGSKRIKILASATVIVLGAGAVAGYWFATRDTGPPSVTVEAAPVDLPPVGTRERLEQLDEGARATAAAVQGAVTSRFSLPESLDEAFMSTALGEPLASRLTVTEWVPDQEGYQYRLCLTHVDGGWVLYDSLYGGIVDKASQGDACPEGL